MAYIYQQISVNQVVTAAFLNQLADSTRDHDHGLLGVSSPVISKSTLTVRKDNSTSELQLIGHTIPANTLGTDRMLEFWMRGLLFNTTGSDKITTWRIRFGTTTLTGTLISSAAVTHTHDGGGSGRQVSIYTQILAQGAANLQRTYVEILITPAVGAPVTNIEALVARGVSMVQTGEDTTAAKLLEVTVQHDAASTSLFAEHHSSRLVATR